MLNKIPFTFATKTVLVLLCLIVVFHCMVLYQVIPYSIVWGGRLENYNQMLGYETTSIVINTFLIITVTVKAKYLKIQIPEKLIDLILWIFVILFSINTIGNLLSKTTLETIIFTPVTLILAILCFRIVNEKSN
jgi:hypothetical protein